MGVPHVTLVDVKQQNGRRMRHNRRISTYEIVSEMTIHHRLKLRNYGVKPNRKYRIIVMKRRILQTVGPNTFKTDYVQKCYLLRNRITKEMSLHFYFIVSLLLNICVKKIR
jgi:hypothetical protein